MANELVRGDCLKILNRIVDNSIDLIVTDPPYGIGYMKKTWDTFEPGGAYQNDKGSNQLPRNKSGHMLDFFVPIWKECFRVLKPGAFMFVICIPRQDCLYKMICSIDNAGFKINFSSIYWTYLTGFPKALNISKAVDKQKGLKREIVGFSKNKSGISGKQRGEYQPWGVEAHKTPITIPKSKEAIELNGSYAGFQPKPAVEVIIVAMKPLSEKTYTNQALFNKKGVTWLEDCRIPSPDRKNEVGRFPANLLVSDNVLNSNSRFFNLDQWAQETYPFLIVPKASKSEKNKVIKNNHPTVKPMKLMSYLITLGSRKDDVILDPFMGSGTAGVACNLLGRHFIGIEIYEEYYKIAETRINFSTKK